MNEVRLSFGDTWLMALTFLPLYEKTQARAGLMSDRLANLRQINPENTRLVTEIGNTYLHQLSYISLTYPERHETR